MKDRRHEDGHDYSHDERYEGGGAFEERARRAFDDSVEALDAATLSRLNRARQAALAGDGGDRVASGWRPVAAAAAVAVLAVSLWLGQMPEEPAAEGEAVVAVAAEEAEDLEIVLQDENLDMLAELEFYDWVDSEEAFRSEPVGSGNIG
ncbi:hypothetical protein [Lentisalinibacter orientalis]|uniref:hypothetical protein n=1 Tax=Lentisalinibacter orientalis TaxID=2992241 RepID=UPI0038656320